MQIAESQYEFKPFNITNTDTWESALDKLIPNLVNVYGEWSEVKFQKMKERGYQVIRTDTPKEKPITGTVIREILRKKLSKQELRTELTNTGYVLEAFEGLFDIINTKWKKSHTRVE